MIFCEGLARQSGSSPFRLATGQSDSPERSPAMFNRFILAAFALGLTAAPAHAAAGNTTVRVAIADLDLTGEAGRATLDARLENAIRNVCGLRPSIRDLGGFVEYRACLVQARASYQEQVGLALNNANARRVAVLADKLSLLASF